MAEFKLGRIKFVWKGVWSASTVYYKDDVVSAGGISYVCVNAHTSGSTFSAGAANWQQMAGGTQYRSNWATSTYYNVGDLVTLNANIYYCTVAHTSTTDLSVDIANWTLMTPGVMWRSTWAGSTIYRVNDLVRFGADVYICTTGHTSSSTFDQSKFSVFLLGLEFANSWNDSTTYAIGDVVTYGGYTYTAIAINVNQTPSTATGYWSVFTTGYNMRGTWSNVTAYKTGDVVQFGGYTYVAASDSTAQQPFIGTTGVNATYWTLIVKGFNHRGNFSTVTTYYPGDVVLVTSSTYVAIAVSLNVSPPNATYWQIIGQGGIGATLTQTGDIAYRYTDGSVIGLHMSDGTQSGSTVQDGYVLKAYSQGGGVLLPKYGEFGYIANVWYVAPSGTDDASHGRTIDKPFATIKYACSVAASGSTIFVKTGTYQEQLPIRVPAGVSVVGDELRTTIVRPASGTSDDGVTPNNRSRMWYLNNGCVLRNMSFTGLTGQFTADAGSSKRLTTNWPSTTASGAYVALDPLGAISSKSPYIQNCSCSGDHAVGLYANGADQASGYKSFVANDFTMVIDDGIGVWTKNGGRAEIVSIFTYYNFIGYLAELGGTIRALNGNNSYGTYGNIATDIDPTDTGFTGTVDNRNNEAQIGNIWVGNGKVLAIGWLYQGQSYTSASLILDSAPTNGTNAAATPVIANGVLSHVSVVTAGSNYQYVTGTARQGGSNVGGTWLAIAATDKMTTDNQYLGMRITILNGTGAGQTGIIKASYLLDSPSTYNKVVYVQTSAGADGWESLTGDPIVTALDSSSQYDILPEIKAVGGTPTRAATLKAKIDPSTFSFTGVYIIDGGSGYGSNPTFTIADPVGSSATFSASILNGALTNVTYASRGTGYVTMSPGTVTGDGFAEIAQTGTYLNFVGLSSAPRPGSIITIAGQSSNFLVIQTVSFSAGTGAANIQVSTSVSPSNPLTQGASATVYQKFSQIRLTGHDYLAIGSGNFASTAYPAVSTLSYIPGNQHVSVNNGRVFYVSTDQDGNLSVGDLFKVNQATGQATLNVSSFNLTGLNSLQLGNTGATVYQFSTDSTLSSNSDTIVPTQKAIRTYISSQLGSGSNNLQVNVLTAGKIYVTNNVITTTSGTNSDLVLQADGSGVIQLSDTANYNLSYAQISALTSASVVNRDYVDQSTRATMNGLYLDANGNLFWTNDVGSSAASIDGSAYVDFFLGNRTTSLLINTSTGNLQVTY